MLGLLFAVVANLCSLCFPQTPIEIVEWRPTLRLDVEYETRAHQLNVPKNSLVDDAADEIKHLRVGYWELAEIVLALSLDGDGHSPMTFENEGNGNGRGIGEKSGIGNSDDSVCGANILRNRLDRKRGGSECRHQHGLLALPVGLGGVLSVESRSFGKDRSGHSGEQGKETKGRAPRLNSCLAVSEEGSCLGGYRRTSRLYEIVSGFSMLLLGLCAGVCLALSQPDGKRTDPRWFAVGAASAIGGSLFLIAAITGKIWLFGL